MPIKRSAVKVSKAMDDVELQLNCAQPFIDAALEKAKEARKLPSLAGYMDERIARLKYDMTERWQRIRATITSVREAIPDGAIEAEQDKLKHGRQQSLI